MNEPAGVAGQGAVGGPVTTAAVSVSPSGSVSLPSTPGRGDDQRDVFVGGVGVVDGGRGVVVGAGDGDGDGGDVVGEPAPSVTV